MSLNRTTQPSGLGGTYRWRLALASIALAVLAACSGDGDGAAAPTASTTAPPPSPVLSSTTTMAVDPVASEIVDRYRQFWQARFAANQAPPNPDAPALRDLAVGQQLDQVVKETRGNLRDSLALRRPEDKPARSSVRLVNVEGDQATVQECVVDDDVVYRYTTGEVVNSAVSTNSVEGTMRRVGGVWKLEAARLLQRWEGVAGCALSSGF